MKIILICLIIVFSVASCHTKNNIVISEPKIAKTVPSNYINKNDARLRKQQDTLYVGNDLYTGYCYSLYTNGDTAFVRSYFNGVEEGIQHIWYPNRQLCEERFYINGKKEGIHQGWWPDGKQKFYFEADSDEYNGEFKEWYASGLLGKDFHYVNGHEEGSEKLWWDNGTIRANYVIRNGKKYGLIGLRTCVNPYDSVVKKQ